MVIEAQREEEVAVEKAEDHYTYTYIHTYTHTPTYTRIYTYTRMYIHLHTHAHVCVRTYTRIYIHTYRTWCWRHSERKRRQWRRQQADISQKKKVLYTVDYTVQ
jgi:hypothetical protein